MTVNSLRFEESSEILIDQQAGHANVGWTINYASVNRIGSLVAIHIELASLAAAALAVLTLPADFAPAQTVTDPTGKFTLSAAGQLAFTGSTTASQANVVCQLTYQAGQASP